MSSLLSLRQLKERRKRDFFVGREDEIKAFIEMIENGLSQTSPILNIVGVGGIGKSTLLRQYIKICKDQKISYALIDGRDKRIKLGIVSGRVICNLPEILGIWREQLSQVSAREVFKEFDNDINRFEKILQKYWRVEKDDLSGLLGLSNMTGDLASSLIGVTVAGVPGAILGAALGSISGSLVNAIGRTAPRLLSMGLDKTEVDFCLHIERNLANSFVLGVNRIIETSGHVVIFLDTFEMIQSFQDWLLNFFLEAEISANLRLVVAGRVPLDSSRWYDWLHLVKTVDLEPLKQKDVTIFLNKFGVRDEFLEKKAYHITNGVPWALRLLADNPSIIDGEWEASVEKSLRYEIARQMVDRFLDQIDDDSERLLIEACAVPLTFEADLISTILGDQFPGRDVWRKIVHMSLFETLPSGRIHMTDPIREFVIDRLQVELPRTLELWNERACEYYKQALSTSRNNLTEYVWEYLYHFFFEDAEARSIFLPRREFLDLMDISIPSLDDARGIVEVDSLTMGMDPQILYSLEDIERFLTLDSSMFRIAMDRESGRIAGYALVIAPSQDWCRKFEAKDYHSVHPSEMLKLDEIGAFGDYLIDTIAVIGPNDRTTAALLMRSILPVLTVRPRKFFAQVISDYGLAIAHKLQMIHLYTRFTDDGYPIECFYFCLYAGQRNAPLYEALEKFRPDVPMQIACQGCKIKECPQYQQYARSN